MKIVTVYTPGALRDETADALRQCVATEPRARWMTFAIDPLDHRAYGGTLQNEWQFCHAAHEGLAIVEPDIVVRPDVIDAFLNCPEPYCAFPYALLTDVMPALGCTRFSAAFIRKYPTLMRDAVATRVGFRQFDIVVQRHILVAQFGEQPHVHLPPVEHLNEAKRLRPDASPEPLMSLPGFTFPLAPENDPVFEGKKPEADTRSRTLTVGDE